MANQEHLQILEQGIEAWNQWRQEHPDVEPNLSQADLSEIDLSGADLHAAELSQAKLFYSNSAELISVEPILAKRTSEVPL